MIPLTVPETGRLLAHPPTPGAATKPSQPGITSAPGSPAIPQLSWPGSEWLLPYQ
jgi:hypothetical protein